MLEQLRRQTKTVLWIVVVGFIGYMFYNWGMNRLQPGGPEPGVMAKVWGERITWEQFRGEYQNQYRMYQESQGQRPDSRAERDVAERAWENLLQRYLLHREAGQRRLEVTEDEISLEMQSNPPDFMRNHPDLQTDSLFDHSKYLNALSDPSLAGFLDSYLRETLPLRKIQDYIGSSVRITDEEARALMRVLEEQVTISYIKVEPLVHVKDPIPDPSEEEVAAYYSSHTEDFRVPEERRLGYVEMPKVPSPEDEIGAREKIEDAFDLISEGEPFEELAPDYSDDQNSASRGGDLGWIPPGRLPAALDSVAQGLETGELSNVIKTEDGFHLIRVEDKRVVDGIEERKISYILSRLEPSPLTIEQISAEAAELTEEAQGGDLDKVASEHDYEFQMSEPYVQEQVTPFLGISAGDAEDLFGAEVGTVIGPLEGSRSFYVFQVEEVIPSRIRPLEEIAEYARQAYVQNQRKQKAKAIAERILGNIEGGASLGEAAASWNIETEQTQPFTRMNYVPGIGRENVVTAHAFALNEGQTSGILEFSDQFYIIRVDTKVPMDEARFRENLTSLKLSLLSSKQQAYLAAWYEKVRESAEIEDYRSLARGY
jgi:peptidyl-prolyl cis-trans isomerase D